MNGGNTTWLCECTSPELADAKLLRNGSVVEASVTALNDAGPSSPAASAAGALFLVPASGSPAEAALQRLQCPPPSSNADLLPGVPTMVKVAPAPRGLSLTWAPPRGAARVAGYEVTWLSWVKGTLPTTRHCPTPRTPPRHTLHRSRR